MPSPPTAPDRWAPLGPPAAPRGGSAGEGTSKGAPPPSTAVHARRWPLLLLQRADEPHCYLRRARHREKETGSSPLTRQSAMAAAKSNFSAAASSAAGRRLPSARPSSIGSQI
ncbi:unnamed protein product [Urochloa humidicola]